MKPFLFLFTFTFLLTFTFYYKTTSLIEQVAARASDSSVVLLLNEFLKEISLLSIVALFCLGIFTVGLWLYYAHRTFGPFVPVRRFIQELQNEEYQKRIILRKHDQFQELAAELNSLAQKLEEKKNEK